MATGTKALALACVPTSWRRISAVLILLGLVVGHVSASPEIPSPNMKHVTISPATTNKNLEFTRDFDQLFPASPLQDAFRRHVAYKAVYETESADVERRSAMCDRFHDTGDPATCTEEKKPQGLVVATSEGSAVASQKTSTAVAGAGDEFRMTPAPQGLVSAIMTAYNNHVNLVIRPDDVWLTILAQFCAYVNKHAEALRSRIVDHEGKIELEVRGVGTLFTADYTYFITAMLGEIRKNIKSPELADWFSPGFSTTTKNDEVSAAATAMASLQSYFEYKFAMDCGIPSVTLMGTVEDWKLLREKIERLLEFEVEDNLKGEVIERWVGYLRKMADGFVESAEHPDSAETLEFWDKVLSHVGGGSGPSYITGWLSALTCFDKDGNFMGNFVAPDRDFPLIDTSEINHNVVSCPVKIDDNGVEYKATLFTGQVALEARNVIEGGGGFPTIRPRNDWCLAVGWDDGVEGRGWTGYVCLFLLVLCCARRSDAYAIVMGARRRVSDRLLPREE